MSDQTPSLSEAMQKRMAELTQKANQIQAGICPRVEIALTEDWKSIHITLSMGEGASEMRIVRTYSVDEPADSIAHDFNKAMFDGATKLEQGISAILTLAYHASITRDEVDRRQRIQQIINQCGDMGFTIRSVNNVPVEGGGGRLN